MDEHPSWERILAVARLLDRCVVEKQRMEPELVVELARSVLAFDENLGPSQPPGGPWPQTRR
jgi:hypothetical protein